MPPVLPSAVFLLRHALLLPAAPSTPFSSLSSGFPPSLPLVSFGFAIRPPALPLSGACVSAPRSGLRAALPVRPMGWRYAQGERECPARAAAGRPSCRGHVVLLDPVCAGAEEASAPSPAASSALGKPLRCEERGWSAPFCDCMPWPGINCISNAISFLSLLPCSPADKVVLLSLPLFFSNLSKQQIAGGNYAVC